MSAEPTLEQLRVVAGWFLLGDNPTNERYEVLADLQEDTGVDLFALHETLVAEAVTAMESAHG